MATNNIYYGFGLHIKCSIRYPPTYNLLVTLWDVQCALGTLP
jgi:hypothetical protein